MARFEAELPTELIKSIAMLNANAQKMLEDMTHAGAEVVRINIIANAPAAFRDSDIMGNLVVTEAYRTPSDGAINTKVAFYGYFRPKKSPGPKWIEERGTDQMAAELVCNVYEYGRSTDDLKHPFIRKSFRKEQIAEAMEKVQEKYLPGGGE